MAQVELLWAAASLMLLGALVGMCMKCQQSAAKRENKELHQQRGRHGNRQTFEVIRTYSIPVARLEQMKSPDSDPVIRSSKEFPTSDLDKSAEDDLDEPDYVNTGPGALPS